jgi:hypothetical protein
MSVWLVFAAGACLGFLIGCICMMTAFIIGGVVRIREQQVPRSD